MTQQAPATQPHVVVFDIGHVLIDWDLRLIYEKLIEDPEKLDWFLTHVVTKDWHFEHDAGKPFAQMVAERSALYPAEATLIEAYADRWIESIPGPIPGTPALVDRLAAGGVPLYAITNFGDEAFALFRPTLPQLEHMRDIVVSGVEKMVKPDDEIFHHAARASAMRRRRCCSWTITPRILPRRSGWGGIRIISSAVRRLWRRIWWRGGC
jgi:2-haloacid dehalogenase